MRTIHITIAPGPRLLRAFAVSAVLLGVIVWRLPKRGEGLFSARVGLACCFVGLAFLVVWGTQRVTGQRWSWLAVLLGVCASALAFVWLTVAIVRAIGAV